MKPHTRALVRALIECAKGALSAGQRAVREWEKWLDAEEARATVESTK